MDEKEIERLNCVIIGSGPAGYTAAIYTARAALNPVVYTGLQMGGQLTTTTEVENFPGYPQGIDGNMLMADLQKQAERFGTEIRMGVVTKVDFAQQPGKLHKLEIDGEKLIEAKTVIIATGASARFLGLPSEERLKGFGVSACAVCDGFFYKGQDVALVGAGDSAAEEALYLSKICKKVYMIVRRDQMRACKVLQDRINQTNNIEIWWNSNVIEVLGQNAVEGISVKNNKTQQVKNIPVTGLFVAIGHHPNSDVFASQIRTNKEGYIITEGNTSLTNLPGVFAAGDIQDDRYRQAISAAGSGCKAALDAERYLTEFFPSL